MKITGAHLVQDNELKYLNNLGEADLQAYFLQKVSRTFALTIPYLPPPLDHAVSNAYLLCRIIDTIEDEPTLNFDTKEEYCSKFVDVIGGQMDPAEFSHELTPLLSAGTTPHERQLIQFAPRIIGITHDLDDPQRNAIKRCIKIMSEGMIHFQKNQSPQGLSDLKEFNHYCYVVAGVVGEMLTDLFCHASPATAKNRDKMMSLATSFGQGLQMTNIIKDIWEDFARSACWLPRDIFKQEGFELENLKTSNVNKGFENGLIRLIGIAHAHLKNALKYTLLISRNDLGIRKFCLLALGMAILTIKKINSNRYFTNGKQVKISRKSVKSVLATSHVFAGSNFLLKFLFGSVRQGIPLVNAQSEAGFSETV